MKIIRIDKETGSESEETKESRLRELGFTQTEIDVVKSGGRIENDFAIYVGKE